ncbi:MAG: type II toxin-antitoxin system HicB family antitoxin [Lachnospiraceae bacterium]|nr:type II toxin-antitoxin system HicB family antitoxin [Lachnospiraceae bacterium]MCD7841613.1 type II toxin-antitoxin system HicB family antitoxin [Lachnospiraceae bacterium]
MLSIYPACFFKEGNSYSVIFPDLNYLATCGDSLEDAMAMAVDCLAGYLKWCHDDKDPVPTPSPLSSVSPQAVASELDIECDEAFVNMVSVDVEAYAKEHFNKSVKKTLTIPAWLNKMALEQGINFSQTLQEALLSKINAT